MIDRVSSDDFERVRQGRARRGAIPDDQLGGGIPAFLGQVISTGGMIGVGKFLMVQPVTVLGAEIEGGSGQITTGGSTGVPVYLIGPGTPATGDNLICRYVDNRWVADRTTGGPPAGGGKTGVIPNCFCSPIPANLSMTSRDSICNYGMFQSCSIQYGPVPAGFADLNLGANAFISSASFPDPISGGAMFQYLLTCYYNQFNLSRIYLSSPYGSPFRDGIVYTWVMGGYGNTCQPFHLDNGQAFPGSDTSCFVTIDGA